jgi:hypothetical protein
MNTHTALRWLCRIEQVIYYLERTPHQPSLHEIAESIHLVSTISSACLPLGGRQSKRSCSSSPRKCQAPAGKIFQHLATYQVGLSARKVRFVITWEAVTPGNTSCEGWNDHSLRFHPTPFGEILLGRTSEHLHLAFVMTSDRLVLSRACRKLAVANLWKSPAYQALIEPILIPLQGAITITGLPNGSSFQLKVWEALLRSSWQCGIMPRHCRPSGNPKLPR